MTYEEIAAEYAKDEAEIATKCDGKMRRYFNEYRRKIISAPADKDIFFEPNRLTSTRGNEYMMQTFSHGKNNFKKYGLFYYDFMYFHRKEGIHVVIDTSNNPVLGHNYSIFIPHFFQRYKERFLNGGELNSFELFVEFFSHNQTLSVQEIHSDKYENSVYMACDQGIVLGSKINNTLYVMKTFITYDMLKGGQVEISQDLSESLCEVVDINREFGMA